MKIICDKCKKELKDLGGLIFSPPINNSQFFEKNLEVYKLHICSECFIKLADWMKSK